MTKQFQVVLDAIQGDDTASPCFLAECPAFGVQIGGTAREEAIANVKEVVQAMANAGKSPFLGLGLIELATIDVEMP